MHLKGHGAKFGRKKHAAIAALLTEKTVVEAARLTGIGVATLRRWMKDPEFAAAYRKAAQEAYAETVARCQHRSGKAVDILETVMDDQNAPTRSRLTAVQIYLQHGKQGVESGVKSPDEDRQYQRERILAIASAARDYHAYILDQRRKEGLPIPAADVIDVTTKEPEESE